MGRGGCVRTIQKAKVTRHTVAAPCHAAYAAPCALVRGQECPKKTDTRQRKNLETRCDKVVALMATSAKEVDDACTFSICSKERERYECGVDAASKWDHNFTTRSRPSRTKAQTHTHTPSLLPCSSRSITNLKRTKRWCPLLKR